MDILNPEGKALYDKVGQARRVGHLLTEAGEYLVVAVGDKHDFQKWDAKFRPMWQVPRDSGLSTQFTVVSVRLHKPNTQSETQGFPCPGAA